MTKSIKSITLHYKSLKSNELIELSYSKHQFSCDIKLKANTEIKINSLAIVIDFNQEIVNWRNHDYNWIDCSKKTIVSNNLSTKCIQLKDGYKILPSKNLGVWEYNSNKKNRLIWRLENKYISPILQFDNNDNKEFIDVFSFHKELNLKLLITNQTVPEFSRSKIPFSSILCFTDHCDFDSLLLLQKQRKLFKDFGIKTTKGFFLNHFSKRDFNASFQREKEELLAWISDGHELAYHSLTQSIRNENDAKNEFENFLPPIKGLNTWIDHGFQPYNFTLIKRQHLKIDDWILKQNAKNIFNYWTYNDCGSGGKGIINQLNPEHFTPKALLSSFKERSFLDKMSFFSRNYLFYFSNNNKIINKYKSLSSIVKSILYQKKFSKIISLLSYGVSVLFYFIKVIFQWQFIKNKTSDCAKFSPILFSNSSFKGESLFFQTLEINNFVETFSKENIAKFTEEKGICIAHTYFSVLLNYHKGRLFVNDKGDINPKTLKVLGFVKNKIENKEIWNPTIEDFAKYYQNFKNIELDINLKGEILFLHHNQEVSYRFI